MAISTKLDTECRYQNCNSVSCNPNFVTQFACPPNLVSTSTVSLFQPPFYVALCGRLHHSKIASAWRHRGRTEETMQVSATVFDFNDMTSISLQSLERHCRKTENSVLSSTTSSCFPSTHDPHNLATHTRDLTSEFGFIFMWPKQSLNNNGTEPATHIYISFNSQK